MDPEHVPHEGAHQHQEIGLIRGELAAMDERHRSGLEEIRREAAAMVESVRTELAAATADREVAAAQDAAVQAQVAAAVAADEAAAASGAAGAAMDAAIEVVDEDQAEEVDPDAELEPPPVPPAPKPRKEEGARDMWDRYH